MPTDLAKPDDATDASGVKDSVDSLLREAAAIPELATGEDFAFPRLKAGELIAERFQIERLAGRGGMGTVYCARDLSSGGAAAVKVMARPRGAHADRFAREAAVLAELSHPAIVRYIAHGQTRQGVPFLAMEWLEGEDLGDRLLREGLSVDDARSLATRVSDALAAAHARGVVHRDVKPSNVFLPAGDARAAKLLDFGVARVEQRAMTRTGLAIGTAGYMAPEQAVGAKDVDARADVFALGCLLYECLTGIPAFAGEQPVAVLAKLLHQQPTPVREVRPEIPEALSRLVERMLAKDRAERPQSGAEVSAALRALGSLAGGAPGVPGIAPSVTEGERRVLSVLLVEPRSGPQVEPRNGAQDEVSRQDVAAVADAVKPFDADVAMLQGGALVVTIAGTGAAHDNAARAARCALVLRESRPDAVVALATGRAETTGGMPVGVAIDRAASLLAMRPSSDGVLLDETTAALLDSSFDVVSTDGIAVLHGRSADRDQARHLLGKPTPCVGREKELGILEVTLAECIDESVARAVLVTAVPGVGKSRLRQEFVARVSERGDVRVLTARADMVRAGSALDLARQIVRSAADVPEGIARDDQWRRLREYVESLGTPEPRLVAEFLGELAGAASVDDPSSQLRSARNDPPTMHEQMRRAFGEWIGAECAKGPLLLVLEDLHWGDTPSLDYLSEALQWLAERPLMIVALARPEVHDAFPKLRSQPGVMELALGGLTRRAAERLVSAALGDSATAETVHAIVERAAGNAFYLEELVRSAAEGRTGELPESVLAMVESRLARLEPAAREVLRAASVFGARFWIEGVARLVPNAAEWMESLVARETIEASRSTRFAAATEYAFRHALMRDAAYAMLTAQGRQAAHRAAAAWLEQIGETDPLAIVMHHELAGDRLAAAPWLLKAASSAFRAGATDQVMAFCDRALAEGLSPELHAERLRLRCGGLASCARWSEAAAEARELMRICSPGTLPWLSAASAILIAAQNGDVSGVADVVAGLSSMRGPPMATRDWGSIAGLLIAFFGELGQQEMALLVKQRLDATPVGPDVDPSFLGHKHAAIGVHCDLSGDVAGQLAGARAALHFLEEAGDRGGSLSIRGYNLPAGLINAGHYSAAGQMAESAAAAALGSGQDYLHDVAVFMAENAPALGGDRAAPRRLRARLRNPSNLNIQNWIHCTALSAELAHSPVDLERLAAAQTEAVEALESGMVFPRAVAGIRSWLALAAVVRGNWSDALSHADAAIGSAGFWAISATEARLARAEALRGLGRFEEARESIAALRSQLLAQANAYADPLDGAAYRKRQYVARALALAAEWLDGAAGA